MDQVMSAIMETEPGGEMICILGFSARPRGLDDQPDQRERLDQIQLQAQGPLAFARPEFGPTTLVRPPLPERLKLSDDQAQRAQAIVEEGQKEIAKAASFPEASTGQVPWLDPHQCIT